MKRIELLAAKIISQLFERSFENANDYEAMIMKNALGLPKDENLILLSELKVLAKKRWKMIEVKFYLTQTKRSKVSWKRLKG